MSEVVLIAVFVLLLLNLVTALLLTARRAGSWLLLILLTGTTGTALIALLAVLTDDGSHRFVEAALVLMGLTALTAAVRYLASGETGTRVVR